MPVSGQGMFVPSADDANNLTMMALEVDEESGQVFP